MRALPSGRAGQPLAPGLRASAQWRAHKRARWMASGRAGWQGLRVWTSAAVRLRGGRRGGARPVIQAVTPSVSVKPQPAFEHRYGLPIVREYAKYHEILRDVRTEKVKEIHWFTQEDEYEVEGPCLIEYKDGSIKQGHIPPSDLRIPFAMNAHNVKGTALRPVPAPEELDPPVPPSERMLEFVSKVLPIIGLIAVYAAVHYMAWLRGDMDDRRKIRQKEKEEARRLKEEISQEQREEEAETLAMMGWDAEDIMEELGRKGIEMDKGYVERLVKRSSAKLG
ncbi:unnamed protein product [Ostreobium quekettii]|uniref:Uncharacterized protein n=1 Tax=Ostreobium quekettii TaxID=121088 RepID=A0A8S1J4K9_9CHLO|nr:unnamed protein product [Ostreobium quekettii]